MCVPRLLGRVDRFRAESWRVAFLSDLSLRLEDIDHRPTGLRHGNPLTDPYSRADRSASDRSLVDPESWCTPYSIVKVLSLPIRGRDESNVQGVVLLKLGGSGMLACL